ncbi:endoglucanase 24-like [Macadamia integrifolia]|uniref:endoglucanase 24-like n=1 Tax=Macadamia integrifolia TaxID=60698 RepID=UPI001C4FE7B4|nr:endoglucanase 24-like [Macadamia integrifolia]
MGADSKSESKGCCGWFIVLLVVVVAAAALVYTIRERSLYSKVGAAPISGTSGSINPVPGPPGSIDPIPSSPGAISPVPGPPGRIDPIPSSPGAISPVPGSPGATAPVPGFTGAIAQKYADALIVSMQFFDVQKSGMLVNNKISWRGDSALYDGREAGLDLSKGMYDAGDHMKFGFPMAFTATMLSWAILEYGDHMSTVKQLEPAQESLKWITDYLINAHPSDNVLYIQVGDPGKDHTCWERPETMSEERPLTQVNTSSPGTDVAAETAAAMAAASLVFKTTNSTYSGLLLTHAEQLFTFADTYKAYYSDSIPQVQTYYKSTGYEDELLWAASWLYHATGDKSYLDYVTVQHGNDFAGWGNPTWFSWDNKLAGTQVLLSRLNLFGAKGASDAENNGLLMYRKAAEAVMCGLLPNSPSATGSRTNGGLIWVSEWDSLQHSVASAFLAVLYSDYMLTSQTATLNCGGYFFYQEDLRKFAMSQADYVLGNNPMRMSYLVGYGSNYPQYVHHRGASIPADANPGCKDGFQWLSNTNPNPNVAVGALVGGPFRNETYIDSRNNSMQGEPSTYNTASVVGLLSGLVTTTSVVSSFT